MIAELNGDFLQWLRGFYYVAKTGSVRKAAQLMHRNPSTISYQIHCLEEELNVVLFDRIRRSLKITEEGKKLLGWTIATFETLKSMRSSLGNVDGHLKGSVHLAGTLPIITLAVPAITRFIETYPNIKLSIQRGLSQEVQKIVVDSEADFGLAAVHPIPTDVEMEILFKARPLLVYERNNQWRIPPVPSIHDLSLYPFIAFKAPQDADPSGIQSPSAEVNAIIAKNAVLFANNYHLMMRFIWHGLGVGIMDELCYHATHFGAEWERIAAVPLDHILPNKLYGILTRKRKRMSPQALGLIKELRTHFLDLPSLNAREAWLGLRQDTKENNLEDN